MARGMANNEPIVSQAQTEAWDEGFDRTFGERPQRAPGRTTYVYRGGRLVEQGGPDDTGFYDESDDARNHIVSDLYMDGVTVDGPEGKIDIGSRAKRRRVMAEKGWADMDDFKGQWERQAKEREAFLRGERRDPAFREQLGRTAYELSKKGR